MVGSRAKHYSLSPEILDGRQLLTARSGPTVVRRGEPPVRLPCCTYQAPPGLQKSTIKPDRSGGGKSNRSGSCLFFMYPAAPNPNTRVGAGAPPDGPPSLPSQGHMPARGVRRSLRKLLAQRGSPSDEGRAEVDALKFFLREEPRSKRNRLARTNRRDPVRPPSCQPRASPGPAARRGARGSRRAGPGTPSIRTGWH